MEQIERNEVRSPRCDGFENKPAPRTPSHRAMQIDLCSSSISQRRPALLLLVLLVVVVVVRVAHLLLPPLLLRLLARGLLLRL